MKVLIIHTTYKYKGGEDTVVAEEIKLLRANGIDVELLEFSNEKNTLLKVLQLPFNFGSYLKTRKKLQAYKADVVHIHNIHFAASPSVIYAVKNRRIPLVLTLHNYRLLCPSATLFHDGKLFLDSMEQRFPWKAVSLGVYKGSALMTFWLAASMQFHKWIGTWKVPSKFIALTPHARQVFLGSSLNLNEEQVTVKPNFAIAPRRSGNHSSAYFAYVGRLSEEKGIELLLKTFSTTGHMIKIAGDGPLKNLALDYTSRFKNIEYLGAGDKDAVFNTISNSSALIFPSIWYEGMPLTIIESFACSVPVIASKIGAMEHMILNEYNGLHFTPGNEQDLSDKLDKWARLSSDELETYKGNAWNTYTKHYSPQHNFRELIGIYKSVMSGPTGFKSMYKSKLASV